MERSTSPCIRKKCDRRFGVTHHEMECLVATTFARDTPTTIWLFAGRSATGARTEQCSTRGWPVGPRSKGTSAIVPAGRSSIATPQSRRVSEYGSDQRPFESTSRCCSDTPFSLSIHWSMVADNQSGLQVRARYSALHSGLSRRDCERCVAAVSSRVRAIRVSQRDRRGGIARGRPASARPEAPRAPFQIHVANPPTSVHE